MHARSPSPGRSSPLRLDEDGQYIPAGHDGQDYDIEHELDNIPTDPYAGHSYYFPGHSTVTPYAMTGRVPGDFAYRPGSPTFNNESATFNPASRGYNVVQMPIWESPPGSPMPGGAATPDYTPDSPRYEPEDASTSSTGRPRAHHRPRRSPVPRTSTPVYRESSPAYSPESPVVGRASPSYSPNSPGLGFGTTSPSYSPASPNPRPSSPGVLGAIGSAVNSFSEAFRRSLSRSRSRSPAADDPENELHPANELKQEASEDTSAYLIIGSLTAYPLEWRSVFGRILEYVDRWSEDSLLDHLEGYYDISAFVQERRDAIDLKYEDEWLQQLSLVGGRDARFAAGLADVLVGEARATDRESARLQEEEDGQDGQNEQENSQQPDPPYFEPSEAEIDRLKQQEKDCQNHRRHLQEELDALRTWHDHWKAEAARLDQLLEDIQGADGLLEELDTLREKDAECKAEKARLQAQIDELQARYNDLWLRHEELQNGLRLPGERQDELRAQIDQLNGRLDDMTDHRNGLLDELLERGEAEARHTAALNDLKARYAREAEQLLTARDAARGQIERQAQELDLLYMALGRNRQSPPFILRGFPQGWELRHTPEPERRVYYIDHNTRTTTWDDPRLKLSAPQRRSTSPPGYPRPPSIPRRAPRTTSNGPRHSPSIPRNPSRASKEPRPSPSSGSKRSAGEMDREEDMYSVSPESRIVVTRVTRTVGSVAIPRAPTLSQSPIRYSTPTPAPLPAAAPRRSSRIAARHQPARQRQEQEAEDEEEASGRPPRKKRAVASKENKASKGRKKR